MRTSEAALARRVRKSYICQQRIVQREEFVRPHRGPFYETTIGNGDVFVETTNHRSSHIHFNGCAVPYFSRCLDLTRQAHEWLPGTYSVGWDIAVTTEGPKLLDGNDNWSGTVPMSYPDIRARFLRMHAMQATTPLRRSAAR